MDLRGTWAWEVPLRFPVCAFGMALGWTASEGAQPCRQVWGTVVSFRSLWLAQEKGERCSTPDFGL